jgi:hypothetical protein
LKLWKQVSWYVSPKALGRILNQVPVRIPHINTAKLPDCPNSIDDLGSLQYLQIISLSNELYSALFYLNSRFLKGLQHLLYILVGQKAQVTASRHDILCFWFKFLAGLMKIDFLVAKRKRMSVEFNLVLSPE